MLCGHKSILRQKEVGVRKWRFMMAVVSRVVRPFDRLDLVMSASICTLQSNIRQSEPDRTCRFIVNQVFPRVVLALQRQRLWCAGIAVHHVDLSCR